MSGVSIDEDRTMLAGEFVLGLLPPDEVALVSAEAASDAALAAEIAAWQRRFEPLGLLVDPVPPPAGLWPRIERSLDGVGGALGGVPAPPAAGLRTTRPLRLWQGATAAGLLLAAAAAIALVALPIHAPAPVPLATLGAPDAPQPAFVLEALAGGAVRVLPLRAVPVPSGHDLELWSLPAGATVPRALGVLPVAGVRLPAGALPDGASRVLVSLEPAGGSPTGRPTGPVLFGGAVLLRD